MNKLTYLKIYTIDKDIYTISVVTEKCEENVKKMLMEGFTVFFGNDVRVYPAHSIVYISYELGK